MFSSVADASVRDDSTARSRLATFERCPPISRFLSKSLSDPLRSALAATSRDLTVGQGSRFIARQVLCHGPPRADSTVTASPGEPSRGRLAGECSPLAPADVNNYRAEIWPASPEARPSGFARRRGSCWTEKCRPGRSRSPCGPRRRSRGAGAPADGDPVGLLTPQRAPDSHARRSCWRRDGTCPRSRQGRQRPPGRMSR